MKKYVLLDKDTYENHGVVRLKWFARHGLAASVAVIAIVLIACGTWTKKKTEYGRKAEAELDSVVMASRATRDSLQELLNYERTMVEECNLHSYIGELFISRKKPKRPTEGEVVEFVRTLNAWYPEYIVAQARQESEFGKTSPKGSNNMFGMKLPVNRETTADNVGTSETYATYKNWELGVIDRVLWELYVFNEKKPSREEYLKKLSKYAEDKNYRKKIEKLSQKYR